MEAIRPLRKQNFRHPDVVEAELEGIVCSSDDKLDHMPAVIVIDAMDYLEQPKKYILLMAPSDNLGVAMAAVRKFAADSVFTIKPKIVDGQKVIAPLSFKEVIQAKINYHTFTPRGDSTVDRQKELMDMYICTSTCMGYNGDIQVYHDPRILAGLPITWTRATVLAEKYKSEAVPTWMTRINENRSMAAMGNDQLMHELMQYNQLYLTRLEEAIQAYFHVQLDTLTSDTPPVYPVTVGCTEGTLCVRAIGQLSEVRFMLEAELDA